MNKHIDQIQNNLAPLKEKLINHPLYARVETLEHLQVFMEHHCFAVWDFMSLLKKLQQELTCVSIPWQPTASADVRRFINEIVLGEESDETRDGKTQSHYEMYRDAMQTAECNLGLIDTFLNHLSTDVKTALVKANSPASIADFVNFSFDTINSNKIHCVASAFTFGREDLIPDMFTAILRDINEKEPGKLADLIYYFERHIELDGDEHGPLSMKLIAELCGEDELKWQEAEQAAIQSLEKRIALWDGILLEIEAMQGALV